MEQILKGGVSFTKILPNAERRCLQCVTTCMSSKAIKMRDHTMYDTVIFAMHGLMPYSSKNCISFKAHQITGLKTSFSCSIQITAKQVFAPAFANDFLNTERFMMVIKFVCLNLYNFLCSVISHIAHGVGRPETEGTWNTLLLTQLLESAAGNQATCSIPISQGKMAQMHFPHSLPWEVLSKGLETLCRSSGKCHCHTLANSSTWHTVLRGAAQCAQGTWVHQW